MYRVRTVFTGVTGTPWYSNLYFKEAEGQVPADAKASVVAWWTAYAPFLVSPCVATVQGEVAKINPEGGQIEAFFSGADTSINGTGATATVLPWQTQGLVRLVTNGVRNGRKVQGRIFLPGMGEGDNENGVLRSTSRATLQSAWDTAFVGVDKPQLVVWARPRVNLGLGQEHLVTGSSVQSKWAFLSSRRD